MRDLDVCCWVILQERLLLCAIQSVCVNCVCRGARITFRILLKLGISQQIFHKVLPRYSSLSG